jgi:D-arabinose 1-dehydrogenase-like Zn-dependent alcohol dehydrogenase
MGARTLAVTSSPDKVERLEELNADELLVAGELDFGELALALTEDKGVDVVVNTVGSEMFDSCLRALAPYGRMLILGEISGGTITLNPAELVFKEARLIGSAGTNKQNLSGAIDMVSQGMIQPLVSEMYSFKDIHIAYQSMVKRESFGRITLKPD